MNDEAALLAPRPDVIGLTRVRIRLGEDPSPTELEKTREQIFSRLVDTPKGVVLDCHEVQCTSIGALAMLYTARTFATAEGKRLILFKVGNEFARLLAEHESTFKFEYFGSQPTTPKPATPKKKKKPTKPLLSAEAKRRIRNIGIPVLVIFPIIALIEFTVLMRHTDSPVMKRVEESEVQLGPLIGVIRGVVTNASDGAPKPMPGASIVAWVIDASPKVHRTGWVTQTGSDGTFSLLIDLRSDSAPLDVGVNVTSAEPIEGSAAGSAADDASRRYAWFKVFRVAANSESNWHVEF